MTETAQKIPVGPIQDEHHLMSVDQAMYNIRRQADNCIVKLEFTSEGWYVEAFRNGLRYHAEAFFISDALSEIYRQGWEGVWDGLTYEQRRIVPFDSISLCDGCRRGDHAEHRHGSCECGYCPDDQPFDREQEQMR